MLRITFVLSLAFLFACGGDDDMPGDGGAAGTGVMDVLQATAELEAFGGASITGDIVFSTAYDGDLSMNIHIAGCTPDDNHDVYIGEGTSCDSVASIGRSFGSVAATILCGSQGTGFEVNTNAANIDEATIGGDSATNIIGHVAVVWAYDSMDSAPPLACGVIVAE